MRHFSLGLWWWISPHRDTGSPQSQVNIVDKNMFIFIKIKVWGLQTSFLWRPLPFPPPTTLHNFINHSNAKGVRTTLDCALCWKAYWSVAGTQLLLFQALSCLGFYNWIFNIKLSAHRVLRHSTSSTLTALSISNLVQFRSGAKAEQLISYGNIIQLREKDNLSYLAICEQVSRQLCIFVISLSL